MIGRLGLIGISATNPINSHGIFHRWNLFDENIFKKNEFPITITKAVNDLYEIPNPPADYEPLQTYNVTVTITKLLLSKVIVSGLQDIENETWSIFNNTYNIEKQTETNIIASYKYAEEDWDGEIVPMYYVVELDYNTSIDTTRINFYYRFGDYNDGNINGHQIIGASKSGNLLNASEITFTLQHLADDKYTHDFSVKLQ